MQIRHFEAAQNLDHSNHYCFLWQYGQWEPTWPEAQLRPGTSAWLSVVTWATDIDMISSYSGTTDPNTIFVEYLVSSLSNVLSSENRITIFLLILSLDPLY